MISRSLTRHRILLLAAGCVLAVGLFFGITIVRIVQAGSGDGVQHADAIVVFGAAEYVGRPSPVYRARLDHAYELFQRGAAPMVITTGGQGEDLHFSEGGVGREYLKRRGIPDSRLIAETQGVGYGAFRAAGRRDHAHQQDAVGHRGQRCLPYFSHQADDARRGSHGRTAIRALIPGRAPAADAFPPWRGSLPAICSGGSI